MKKLTILLALFFSIAGVAQKAEGEVTYLEKINMHNQIPDGPQKEMILSLIPEFQETKSTLLFSQNESLYQPVAADNDQEIDQSEGDMQVKIKMEQPDEKVYMDLKNSQTVQQKDLMGKIFLIKDSIYADKWKITGEQKEVASMQCMRAEMLSDSSKVVAWFTSEIPVSAGPLGIGGLPGLILYLKIDEDMEVFASNLVMRKLERNEIKPPSKGKVVTQKEYDKIAEEKMRQMREQFGGEGNVIIHTIEE